MITLRQIDNSLVTIDESDIVGLTALSPFIVDVVVIGQTRIIVSGRLEEVRKDLEDQGVKFPIEWSWD